MSQTNRRADYDQIAASFEARYDRNSYAGVERALREFIGSGSDLQVLEVGCGTGHWLEILQSLPGIRLAGLDFSPGMLAQARRRLAGLDLVQGTAERLPLPAESFDRVFCINALHHFPDKPAFLAEARRILRSGGKLLSVGLDPHRGRDRWFIYDYFPESVEIDRQRYASAHSLQTWMKSAGFENPTTQELEHWAYRLPADEIQRQGRLDKTATSQLNVLTDQEYRRGMEKIRKDREHADAQGETLFLTADLRLYGTTGSVSTGIS